MKRCLVALFLVLLLIAPGVGAQKPVPTLGPGEIPPGYILVEGDILVREQEYRERGLRSSYTSLWPGGVVPYFFDGGVSAAHQAGMRQAMNDWEAAANVHFNPIGGPGGDYWVRVQNGSGNNSMVGPQAGGQVINIANWDEFKMAHELGHCLGLVHEQSRPDRDSYVQINWGNIQAGFEHNFNKQGDAGWVGPYDFDSLMHYDQCAFSTDCPAGWSCACTHPVITVLPPNQAWQTQIGQETHLSFWDRRGMAFYYAPSNWRWLQSSYSGIPLGTLFSPYNNLGAALAGTPAGGTLWIWGDASFSGAGTYTKPMTLRAVVGTVTIGK